MQAKHLERTMTLPLIHVSPNSHPYIHLLDPRIAGPLRFLIVPGAAMGQILGGLWDRAQGKWHLRRSCDKIFDQCADKDKGLLALSNLHLATLMVYLLTNKQLFSPFKEPPSKTIIETEIKDLSSKGTEAIDREKFYQLILNWIQKDLHMVLANRIVLSLLAAPAMAVITKNAAKDVPRIKNVAEKVPTPLVASVFSVGLVLLQDIRAE